MGQAVQGGAVLGSFILFVCTSVCTCKHSQSSYMEGTGIGSSGRGVWRGAGGASVSVCLTVPGRTEVTCAAGADTGHQDTVGVAICVGWFAALRGRHGGFRPPFLNLSVPAAAAAAAECRSRAAPPPGYTCLLCERQCHPHVLENARPLPCILAYFAGSDSRCLPWRLSPDCRLFRARGQAVDADNTSRLCTNSASMHPCAAHKQTQALKSTSNVPTYL